MNYLLLIFIFIPVVLTQLYYYYKLREFEAKGMRLLEEKVEEVILTMRSEIPLGETFLKGALLERIKGKAKTAVVKLVAQFKEGSRNYWPLVLIPWGIALVVALLAVAAIGGRL